jgi:hypothetical protein
VKFLIELEISEAPRVVCAAACQARDATNSIAVVAAMAIAVLRIALLPARPGPTPLRRAHRAIAFLVVRT